MHLSPMTGHEQPEKLVKKLKNYVIFKNMTKHAEDVVRTCGPCLSTRRESYHNRVPMTKTDLPNSTMDILSADLQGPLKTSSGNVYLAYVMDLFSRYCWIGVLKNRTPKLLFEFLMDRIFTRHGTMNTLLSDQGTDINSKLHNLLLQRLGVRRRITSTYCPQSDAANERVHKTINDIIKRSADPTTGKSEKDLKEIVRIAELAYNTTPHSSTKLSPYFIQFGRNPSIDYFYPQSHQHQQLPQDQLHQKMELYMEIKKRLQATQAKDMYQFNKGKTWSPLKVGQQVLLRRFTTPEGRNRKLLPAFGKIHTITKVLSDQNVQIVEHLGQPPIIIHTRHLRPLPEEGLHTPIPSTDQPTSQQPPARRRGLITPRDNHPFIENLLDEETWRAESDSNSMTPPPPLPPPPSTTTTSNDGRQKDEDKETTKELMEREKNLIERVKAISEEAKKGTLEPMMFLRKISKKLGEENAFKLLPIPEEMTKNTIKDMHQVKK